MTLLTYLVPTPVADITDVHICRLRQLSAIYRETLRDCLKTAHKQSDLFVSMNYYSNRGSDCGHYFYHIMSKHLLSLPVSSDYFYWHSVTTPGP